MANEKISIFAWFSNLVYERGIEYAADLVKECGYRGVEFFPSEKMGATAFSPATAVDYKKALDARGLVTVCVSCGVSLIKEDSPDVIDMNTVKKLCEYVDFAEAIGARLLHHTLYFRIDKKPEFHYDDAYAAILEGARLVAEYAEKHGVRIIYEPQGWLFNGKKGFLRFYNDIKSLTKNVGICLDVGNTYWVDEDPLEITELLSDEIFHVHIKDYAIGDGLSDKKTLSGLSIREVPIGSGMIPIPDILRILKKNGYSGFYSIEDSTDTTMKKKCQAMMNIFENL